MNKKSEKAFVFRILGLPLLSFNSCRISHQTVPETEGPPSQLLPAEAEIESKGGEPLFVINSLMLYRCFNVLTRTRSESLHAVTGSVLGNVRSLERIVSLSLSVQGVAGAAAEDKSLANEFILLNEFGLRPLAYFHSHPGYGVSATRPSGTDRQTQSTMEQSGSDIIGGIFSRDGFVRFYANRGEPNVRVVGKRVKEVRKNVYKLETEKNL